MLASRAKAAVAVLKETLAAGAEAMLATQPDLSQKDSKYFPAGTVAVDLTVATTDAATGAAGSAGSLFAVGLSGAG